MKTTQTRYQDWCIFMVPYSQRRSHDPHGFAADLGGSDPHAVVSVTTAVYTYDEDAEFAEVEIPGEGKLWKATILTIYF